MMVIASACNKTDVITVTIDDNYRAATDSSSVGWSEVMEYTPAPGQFIGDTQTGGFTGEESTPADAAKYAAERLTENKFVSLGGFGGYIVVGFDHSVDNTTGYDLAIRGNAFDGSSEPGIVWVSRDENGNAIADDEWYELSGSDTMAESTIRAYSVTYYRSEADNQPVKWTDSEGSEGEIDYLAAYHKQSLYYPKWIGKDNYTLTGTRLEARNYDKSGTGTMWVQPAYGWGYADNFSAEDYVEDDKSLNLFDIANAIDRDGLSVELEYIDFVKVQTACNAKSGWLGEQSTEVVDFLDYGLMLKRNE
ncbi:MAG: hypothetical protein J6Q29_05545 [Alistipes sp.]|nr:hypothetical protein [Alistipes sp.]